MKPLEEFSIRAGEGTPYAATLTCLPDCENEWIGLIKFDDNDLNLHYDLSTYDDKPFIMHEDWHYWERKSGGTHLMNLLEGWHKRIVDLFERVKEKAKNK